MSANLEKGLYSMITGNSPQTSAASRVYPRLPQGVTFPAIRYKRVATQRQHALDSEVGVTMALVQVDCMAENYDEAKTLADQVRAILHGHVGAFGSLTARLVDLDTETDLEEINGDDVTHWVAQRYRIFTDMD